MDRRRVALAALLGFIGLLGADPGTATGPGRRGGGTAWAEPERLTVKSAFSGPPIATPLPDWDWRPGHAELVRTVDRDGRRVLVGLDPVTGTETDRLDLAALDALVEGAGGGFRGIGRAGPPGHRWAPSGTALAVVVKGEVVWADLASGARRRLTRSSAPMSDLQVSPDGAHVSFARGNDLWVVPTAGGEERRLTTGGSEDLLNATLDWVYPEELGFDTAAWWSPDGRRLAYLQLDETGVLRFPLPSSLAKDGAVQFMRYPKAGGRNPVARVGVVAVEGGPTTWIDLVAGAAGGPPEYVARVAWSPDSRRLLVATLDRAQRRLRLLSADVATGASATLLEETDPAWVDAPPPPRFLDARRFLWRSHRDGSTRWWIVALDESGRVASEVPVTPSGVDADDVLDVDPAKDAVLVAATPFGSPRTTVIASGAAAPDRFVRAPFLRDADRSVRASMNSAARLVVVTTSDAVTPPRREVRRVEDGTVVRVLGDGRSAALDALTLARPEYGEIETPDGRIRWRLWTPADLDRSRKHAVVVQVYGGPGSRMVRDEWGRGPFLETLLADRGVLVLEADGRGTAGQGARYERLVQGRLGLRELQDQVRAVEELAKRPWVDRERVGIWGWSYGGTMVCNALCRRSDLFRTGVAVAPVTDWRNYDTIYTERYMGTPEENAEGYDAASCVKAAGTMGGRLLLVHGLGDDNVHPQNTFQLVQALLDAGKTRFDVMAYPDSGHGLPGRHPDVFGRLLDVLGGPGSAPR